MYTTYTYQDWEKAAEARRPKLAFEVVDNYKSTPEFLTACDAELYFVGSNPTILRRKKLTLKGVQTYTDPGQPPKTVPVDGEVVTAKIPSNFLFRFVTQQNQFLLSNGLKINDAEGQDGKAIKAKLGAGFDKTLEQIGEKALLHGVCYGFFNRDHVEMIQAANGTDCGAVALVDEVTSAIRVVIQFWRVSEKRSRYARIFEEDGITLVEYNGTAKVKEAKKAYITRTTSDGLGTTSSTEQSYSALPVVAFYANNYQRSELTDSLRQKMDAYDVILSDFADNLERTNDVYWAISNFGGTADDVIAMLAEINRIKAVYAEAPDSGQSSATPHTIEVPYAARQTALNLLEKAMYKDYMALNLEEITGGSLTNVAIKAAMANLNLKTDRYEWQAFSFCQQLLRLAGIETENIAFRRQTIVNDGEIIESIYLARADLTRKKALELNPMIEPDEIPQLLIDVDAEQITGQPTVEQLQAEINAGGGAV